MMPIWYSDRRLLDRGMSFETEEARGSQEYRSKYSDDDTIEITEMSCLGRWTAG